MKEEVLVYIGVVGWILIGWLESVRIVAMNRRSGEDESERWRSLQGKRFLIFGMRFEILELLRVVFVFEFGGFLKKSAASASVRRGWWMLEPCRGSVGSRLAAQQRLGLQSRLRRKCHEFFSIRFFISITCIVDMIYNNLVWQSICPSTTIKLWSNLRLAQHYVAPPKIRLYIKWNKINLIYFLFLSRI